MVRHKWCFTGDWVSEWVSMLCEACRRTERLFTRWWRLDLGLLLLLAVSDEGVRWRFFTTLHLTLISEQVLDVLLLQRAGWAAGCPHVQKRGELTPLLILIHLNTGWRGYGEIWEMKKWTYLNHCIIELPDSLGCTGESGSPFHRYEVLFPS